MTRQRTGLRPLGTRQIGSRRQQRHAVLAPASLSNDARSPPAVRTIRCTGAQRCNLALGRPPYPYLHWPNGLGAAPTDSSARAGLHQICRVLEHDLEDRLGAGAALRELQRDDDLARLACVQAGAQTTSTISTPCPARTAGGKLRICLLSARQGACAERPQLHDLAPALARHGQLSRDGVSELRAATRREVHGGVV